MRYRVQFEIFDMKTLEIQVRSVEYFYSDSTPDEIVNSLFSVEPFTMNLDVQADVHPEYCDLTLLARGFVEDTNMDNFSREREILQEHFTLIDQFEIPNMQHSSDFEGVTSLEVNLNFYLNPEASEEIERAIAAEFNYFCKYRSRHRAEVGASEESSWLKLLIDGTKTFLDVINIFLLLKSMFEKYGRKDLPTQDIRESEFRSKYKTNQFDKYLIAVSRDINIPLDKINVKFKSVSIDGTYMRVETDKGTYSVQFNNNHQIIMINKFDL